MKEDNMSLQFNWWALALIATSMALLSGCSTLRNIESKVQTSVQWPTSTGVPTQAFYRLERLPADINNLQAGWAEIELQPALAALGWTRNDVNAQYSVWIGVRAAEYEVDMRGRLARGPWLNHFHMNIGNAYRPRGVGVGMGWTFSSGSPFNIGMRPDLIEPPIYVREVSIIVRDLKTSQVVYQTTATHDGPWSDHQNIWRTMIPAALQGFPNPAQTTRSVVTPIAR
jgi:hypothetical protein